MKSLLAVFAFFILIISHQGVSAKAEWVKIKGEVNPALAEVIFNNSGKIEPTVFENDHHAINKCYRIPNGYFTIVDSGEGLFEGYELNKYIPEEISDKILILVEEKVTNKAGIYLGISRKEAENLLKQQLSAVESRFYYESKKVYHNIDYDVATTVIIRFEEDKLTQLRVITSTTS